MDVRLLVLTLATFAIGTDNYVVAGILPRVADSFSVDVPLAGQFVTAYSLVYGLSTPLVAAATAHWPRRRVLLVGLLVFVVGNVLTATQTVFELGLVSRAIAGLGGAMVTPAAGAAAAAMVAPERRGRALAIVLAGLSGATALGAPIGTAIAGAGDWRFTMWVIAAIGTLAALGILTFLPSIPTASAPRLRERLAPLGDARVVAILTTTVLAMLGVFLVYTYISVVFDRAVAGGGNNLAVLLSIWGIAATAGNLAAGSLTDRFGNRIVINVLVVILTADFALMPWSSRSFAGAAVALAVWGSCGWGFVVSQQHRLVGIAPALAPVLIALNAAAIYLAVSVSGAAGGVAIRLLDPHWLPLVSALLVLGGLISAEAASRLIRGVTQPPSTASPRA